MRPAPALNMKARKSAGGQVPHRRLVKEDGRKRMRTPSAADPVVEHPAATAAAPATTQPCSPTCAPRGSRLPRLNIATAVPPEVAEPEHRRLDKRDVCVLLAMWFEHEPRADRTACRRGEHPVGVICVDRNGIIIGAECTRQGLHASQRLVLALGASGLEGSTLYMSRCPCNECLKQLVQARVKQIFYYPAQPEGLTHVEWHAAKQAMVRRGEGEEGAAAAQAKDWAKQIRLRLRSAGTVCAPHVFSAPGEWQAQYKHSQGATPVKRSHASRRRAAEQENGLKLAWSEQELSDCVRWDMDLAEGGNINTAAKRRQEQQFHSMQRYLGSIIRKYGNIALTTGCAYPAFEEYTADDNSFTGIRAGEKVHSAAHALIAAAIALLRTDDPDTGVGAMLKDRSGRVISIGWNGTPAGATSLQYPTLTDPMAPLPEQKLPYMCSAVSNAINLRAPGSSLDGATMYTTMCPDVVDSHLMTASGITELFVLGNKFGELWDGSLAPDVPPDAQCAIMKEEFRGCFKIFAHSSGDELMSDDSSYDIEYNMPNDEKIYFLTTESTGHVAKTYRIEIVAMRYPGHPEFVQTHGFVNRGDVECFPSSLLTLGQGAKAVFVNRAQDSTGACITIYREVLPSSSACTNVEKRKIGAASVKLESGNCEAKRKLIE
eukprot:COSAG01_NODE_2530_length_7495_cov_76.130206_4_plen_659_part_00